MAAAGNAWNRLRYTLWAPGYHLAGRLFDGLRRRSLHGLGLRAGQRVLLVAAGTGNDLAYLPPGVRPVATDITPAMLRRARGRHPRAALALMDAHRLAVAENAFDAAILHLALAVVSDPSACLRECARAVRHGGHIAVMDKFLPAGVRPSLPRRAADLVSGLFFTEINRRFEDILAGAGAPLVVEADEPAAVRGFYRIIRLRKR